MSLNTSLAEGEVPTYAMPQPKGTGYYPSSNTGGGYNPTSYSSNPTSYSNNPTSYSSHPAPTYNKSYPTASSYTGSGKVGGLTGPTSSYPLASSGAGYGAGSGAGSGAGYGASYNPSGYTGSTSQYPASSAAPQQYTGSTSQYPASTAAPQQYTGSTSSYPSNNAAPQQYSGSTSQYPAPVHSSSTTSFPAPAANKPPAAPLQSTTSYAPSTATMPERTTKEKAYQSQQSTFSRATGRSQMTLDSPAARLAVRGPAPHFRPWMIILVTMSLGILFLGVVLTVVAHWPGSTSIGADPLEIVGPCLLAAGGVGLIVCVVLSIVHTRQEKQTFMKRIAASQRSIYNSRMNMQQSMHSIAQFDEQQQMMKAPNSYGAPVPQQTGEGDSGNPSTQTYNSNNTNLSYEPDESDTSEQGKFEVYRIDTLPDPSEAKSNGTGAASGVPQPVRTRTRDTKKKATADPQKYAANVSSDPNYQPSTQAGRTSPMAGSGALGGLGGIGSPMSGAPDLGGSRGSRQMHNYSGEGYDMYAAADATPQKPAKPAIKEKPKKSKKPKREAEAMQASGDPANTSNEWSQEPLRINIRAQPGAAVSITPGFSQYGQGERHQSEETEI